jgi:hypothetical protein
MLGVGCKCPIDAAIAQLTNYNVIALQETWQPQSENLQGRRINGRKQVHVGDMVTWCGCWDHSLNQSSMVLFPLNFGWKMLNCTSKALKSYVGKA